MVNFESVSGCTVTEKPYMQGVEKEENGEEEYEACFHQAGKKRRLTSEQVQFLEKNFEVENKLEPERKVQLAKELGLQPRQVAIWFQNRRARFKTKQLEKDYGTLKASYDKLKSDTDTLLKENNKLKEEVIIVNTHVLLTLTLLLRLSLSLCSAFLFFFLVLCLGLLCTRRGSRATLNLFFSRI